MKSLHSHTGYWLNRLSSEIENSFIKALKEYNITPSQWGVLITIYNQDADTPHSIAKFIDVDTGGVTRLLDRMEKKGQIIRIQNPKDRRSIKIKLTETAEKLAENLFEVANQNDLKFLSILTSEEERMLRRLIDKILSNTGIKTPRQWRDQ